MNEQEIEEIERELLEACRAFDEHQEMLDEATHERNQMLSDAHKQGVTAEELADATELPVESVRLILSDFGDDKL